MKKIEEKSQQESLFGFPIKYVDIKLPENPIEIDSMVIRIPLKLIKNDNRFILKCNNQDESHN